MPNLNKLLDWLVITGLEYSLYQSDSSKYKLCQNKSEHIFFKVLLESQYLLHRPDGKFSFGIHGTIENPKSFLIEKAVVQTALIVHWLFLLLQDGILLNNFFYSPGPL